LRIRLLTLKTFAIRKKFRIPRHAARRPNRSRSQTIKLHAK